MVFHLLYPHPKWHDNYAAHDNETRYALHSNLLPEKGQNNLGSLLDFRVPPKLNYHKFVWFGSHSTLMKTFYRAIFLFSVFLHPFMGCKLAPGYRRCLQK